MTKKADDKRGTLDSLRLDLAEIGDEIWSDHSPVDLDDSDPSAAPAQNDVHAGSAMSSSRPQRATRLRTREEIFEHRMAVMAHRRAQLDAHRNRQARKWFALTGALLFVGASGLGAFYYRTADDWKFLSAYSLDSAAYQSVQTASAAADGGAWEGTASSHFQNSEKVFAASPAAEPRQQQIEEVKDVAEIEVPRLPDVEPELEKAAEPLREPVAPAAAATLPEEQASPETAVAELEAADKPEPNFIRPETKRLVRVAPTAMPAPPKTVYNVNNAKPVAATSELIMVPVEPAEEQATQKVASLSPKVIAPKSSGATDSTTVSDADDAAIESALSVPPESMELDSSGLAGDSASGEQAASPLPPQNGKAVSVLLERGDKLLLLGDIVSARQLYQHAFQQGDLLAAARIGSTYDPRIFAQLGVQGLRPDTKLALKWYNRAADAGDEDAKQTARSLSRQLNGN